MRSDIILLDESELSGDAGALLKQLPTISAWLRD